MEKLRHKIVKSLFIVAEPEIEPRLSHSRVLGITGLGFFWISDLKDEAVFTGHTGSRGQEAEI